ncbi:MAG TPA: hypothetical protein VF406_09765 [Thermodesulfobacteriota bacterium]
MAAERPAVRVGLLVALLVLAAGCSSPEASRGRGGGAGADPRNTGALVQMHGGSRPYQGTPCLGGPAACAEQEASTAMARSGSQ